MILRSSLLPALAAFAAAARHQNFAHAADELHLTASAVSHHVRKLEAILDVSLFHRHARGVALTPEGRLLADAAGAALADLSTVMDTLHHAKSHERVRITALPSFVANWLTPRLGNFAHACPNILLAIDNDRALARFDDAGPDLGIRYGPGQWPGLVSRFLMDDSLLPLAAPTLAGLRDVREPKHIARLRLISDLVPESWREWFRAAKVRNVRLAPTHIISDSSNSLDAAAAGLGAVLARKRLATRHLADGRLIRLPGPELPARYGYYIVHGAHRPLSIAANSFVGWIEREAQLQDAAPDESPRRRKR